MVAKVEWHPGNIVLQSAGQSGAIDQGKQECRQMDAAVVPQVPRRSRPVPASRPGQQTGQSNAGIGFGEGGRVLGTGHAAGEISQVQRKSHPAWSQCDVPIGRRGGADGTFSENPEPDR